MSIQIPPLRWWEKVLDVVFIPLMYLVSGTFTEAPQRTHLWNNIKLRVADVGYFDSKHMVFVKGVKATSRWLGSIPIFHLPILGGWRKYIVLQPTEDLTRAWHIGWIAGDVVGVSRIPLRGPVRVLRGPGDVRFFACTNEGVQMKVVCIGCGVVGEGGEYKKVPLL